MMMNEERNPLVFSLLKFTKVVFLMLIYLPKALHQPHYHPEQLLTC